MFFFSILLSIRSLFLLILCHIENNLQLCKSISIPPHPARFPQKLPMFFIKFLTDTGDKVLDIFAGSNTTGFAAEQLERSWIAFEKDPSYLASSAFRFLDKSQNLHDVMALYESLIAQKESVCLTTSKQLSLKL